MAFFSSEQKKKLANIKTDVKATFGKIGNEAREGIGKAYASFKAGQALKREQQQKKQQLYDEAYAVAERGLIRRKAHEDAKRKYAPFIKQGKKPSYAYERNAAAQYLGATFSPPQAPQPQRQQKTKQQKPTGWGDLW